MKKPKTPMKLRRLHEELDAKEVLETPTSSYAEKYDAKKIVRRVEKRRRRERMG